MRHLKVISREEFLKSMPCVVGLVTACEPMNDKLKKCSVDIGAEEAVIIVTNAPNVREGTRTVCALVGTIVCDVEVKKQSVGGVMSEGILCDSKMLNWVGGAEGLCVQVPPTFALGAAAPTSKPRMDGGTAPAKEEKSEKDLKAEAKAAKKAEAAAKKEARKAKKESKKAGKKDGEGEEAVEEAAKEVSNLKVED